MDKQPPKNGRNGHGRTDRELCAIPRSQRLLLLPHCLRPSQGCPGRMTRQGLVCDGCTRTDCKIQPLRQAALDAGYQVCVAPGGRLAVRFVAENQPAGIVAVACNKELQEGVAAVQALDWAEWEQAVPPIFQIPLTREGCVETDVDLDLAIQIIES